MLQLDNCTETEFIFFLVMFWNGWEVSGSKITIIPWRRHSLSSLVSRLYLCLLFSIYFFLSWTKDQLYTLFRTAKPNSHTQSSGASPYSPDKVVPHCHWPPFKWNHYLLITRKCNCRAKPTFSPAWWLKVHAPLRIPLVMTTVWRPVRKLFIY